MSLKTWIMLIMSVTRTGGNQMMSGKILGLFDSTINSEAILDLYQQHTEPFDVDMDKLGIFRLSNFGFALG